MYKTEKNAIKKLFNVFMYVSLIFFIGACQKTMDEANTAYDQGNYEKALKIYKYYADKGDSDAYLYLGKMYYEGIGTNKDYDSAFKYFQKLSDAGNAIGTYSLGILYLEGTGVSKNEEKAYGLIKSSAQKNLGVAKNMVGYMLHNGIGVKANHEESCDWYEKSANDQDISAIYELGCCYYMGLGREKDLNIGTSYIKKSSDLGFFRAKITLSEIILENYLDEKSNVDELNYAYELVDQATANGIEDNNNTQLKIKYLLTLKVINTITKTFDNLSNVDENKSLFWDTVLSRLNGYKDYYLDSGLNIIIKMWLDLASESLVLIKSYDTEKNPITKKITELGSLNINGGFDEGFKWGLESSQLRFKLAEIENDYSPKFDDIRQKKRQIELLQIDNYDSFYRKYAKFRQNKE